MHRFCFAITLLASLQSATFAGSPYQGPAVLPPPLQKTVAYEMPVCCDRLIDYVHLRLKQEPCGPRYETTALVRDLCAECLVEVPLCLPACASGPPKVCHKGMHVVLLTWNNGYTVRVILKNNGRVIVHYNA